MPFEAARRKSCAPALTALFAKKDRYPASIAERYASAPLLANMRHAVASKTAERIDALEQRLRELKVQHQRSAARKRTQEARRTRREDTRRKVLVGAVVLAKVDQGVIDGALLRGWLNGALTREEDRALFGLAPTGLPE